MRASEILKGDAWDYHVDAIFAAQAMGESVDELKMFLKKADGLSAGVAQAARVGMQAVP